MQEHKKCFHTDRNREHRRNALNMSFPSPHQMSTFADYSNNEKIIARAEGIFNQLTYWNTFPGVRKRPRLADGLPVLGRECGRCRLRDALWKFARATAGVYNYTAESPTTAHDLEKYCHCTTAIAFRDLSMTQRHLPRPFSIHPFYTDRRASSLYRTQDPYSWWVWLRGNNFFVPWRQTNIDELEEEEVKELFRLGWWHNTFPGSSDYYPADVRKMRGVKISKKDVEKAEQICKYQGKECIEIMLR